MISAKMQLCVRQWTTPKVAQRGWRTKNAPNQTTGSIFMLIQEGKLLQGLLNSNCHGNGHTNHGVVTSAQEAHHLNVKSACLQLFACGAGTFGAGSPTFHKTRSTSHESSMLCFPSMGTSYHIMCSRNKMF
jgi:hypothetical protein